MERQDTPDFPIYIYYNANTKFLCKIGGETKLLLLACLVFAYS